MSALRTLRKQIAESQCGLGRLIGVSEQSVARWEKGMGRAPRAAIILMLILAAEARGKRLSIGKAVAAARRLQP